MNKIGCNWGLCPQTPGVYRFRVVSKVEETRRGGTRPALLPTPGMALGSVPTVALPSTQAIEL
jgi:hypothetical protein